MCHRRDRKFNKSENDTSNMACCLPPRADGTPCNTQHTHTCPRYLYYQFPCQRFSLLINDIETEKQEKKQRRTRKILFATIFSFSTMLNSRRIDDTRTVSLAYHFVYDTFSSSVHFYLFHFSFLVRVRDLRTPRDDSILAKASSSMHKKRKQ